MTQSSFGGDTLLNPHEVMREALSHEPARTVVGFSGGGDSIVVAHWAVTQGYTDTLFHIDTGTALPGVREHVETCAELLGAKLLVYSAAGYYRAMVLGLGDPEGQTARRPALSTPMGFPGPAQHGAAYAWLKKNQFRQLVRDTRKEHGPKTKVLIVTGLRRAESSRRSRRPALRIDDGSLIFANPMIDWDKPQMLSYQREHELPTSDVSALIHMSGECTCGAFAAPGEREMLKSLWPEWWEQNHGATEAQARERGIPGCVWGQRPPVEEVAAAREEDPGDFCSSCQLKLGEVT